MLEYFISTHGARKGLADTALRTADSGYLRGVLSTSPRSSSSAKRTAARAVASGLRTCSTTPSVARCSRRPARPLPHQTHVDRRHRDPAANRDDDDAIRPDRLRPASRTCVSARVPCARRSWRVLEVLRHACSPPQDCRPRRGCGHRGRTVDRRAGHPAHDAYVPLRRRRRRGHHHGCPAWSSCSRPAAEGGVAARRVIGVVRPARTRRASAWSRSSPTTAPSSSTRCRAGRTSRARRSGSHCRRPSGR